jgi:hypothetical protein
LVGMAKRTKRTTAYKTSDIEPKRKHDDAEETDAWAKRLRTLKVLSVEPLRGSRIKTGKT